MLVTLCKLVNLKLLIKGRAGKKSFDKLDVGYESKKRTKEYLLEFSLEQLNKLSAIFG